MLMFLFPIHILENNHRSVIGYSNICTNSAVRAKVAAILLKLSCLGQPTDHANQGELEMFVQKLMDECPTLTYKSKFRKEHQCVIMKTWDC